jgi:hypothetical protein
LDWHVQVFGTVSGSLKSEARKLGLSVQSFDFNARAEANGLQQGSAYLVRPDSHIAVILPDQDPKILQAYMERIGLNLVGV